MNDKLLSIQDAAKILNVSIKTLHRWEEKGLITPERTDGNHRRFHLQEIQDLINQRSQPKVNTPTSSNLNPIIIQTEPTVQSKPIAESISPLGNILKSSDSVNTSSVQQETASFTSEPNFPSNNFLKFSNIRIKNPYVISGLVTVISLFLLGAIIIGSNRLSHPGDLSNGALAASNGNSKQNASLIPDSISLLNPNQLTGTLELNIPVEMSSGLTVNANSQFNGNIKVNNKNVSLGTGQITASNILYGINPGQNITISGNPQNPTISASLTSGVTSLGNSTGAITIGSGISLTGNTLSNSGVTSLANTSGAFTLGSGLSLSGNTLSNSDLGSSQDIFKNISANGSTITAGSNSDTVTFTPGAGISLSTDTTNKNITISSNAFTPSNLNPNGVLYADTASSFVSLAPGNPGFVLESNGSGSPPSWIANTASNAFSAITSGTNTGASMVVGTGATLDYTGSGTINASSLDGNTFASPGTIGSTTAGIGIFTSITGTSLSLTNNSNELSLGTGNTGTITLQAGLSASQIYTLPDQSGTFCLTTGNCSGVGGGLTGSGTAGQLAYFASASGITSPTTGLAWDANDNSLGIGIDTPTSKLEVSGANAGIALAIFNETGDQDIFTASSSGNTEFTIGNNGSLTAPYYATNGGLLYTNGTSGSIQQTATGATGQILTVNGSGIPTWTSPGGTLNYWQLSNGAISPANSTNDLLLGSTATSSAKFAFANVAGGTPTASISAGLPGSLYLTATGILATTANQTLTLGAPGTGNIVLGNGLGNGVAHISASGLLTSSSIVNGDLSTGTFSNITGVGALSTGSIATGFGAINTSNAITGTVLNATTQLNTGGTERIDSSGNLDNIGTTQFNTVTYTWPGANGASGSILTDTGGTLSWSSASSVNFWQLNSNALSPLNEQNDLLLGSTATSSAKFAFANVAGGTPTASISAGLPGSLYLTATGILATTANQTLTLGAPGTGNIVLGNGLGNGVAHISASGLLTSSSIVNGDLSTGTFSNITGVGALSTGSIATGFGAINTSNAITGTVLNATTQLNTGGTERIDSSGNLDNIGTTQFNTVTYTWPGANGASGSILTDTGGTLSWSSASSVNFWQLNSNALSPLNEQNDLLLGSTATSSAKFAFANVAGGTPTASISAGLPGSLYLTATGILATTANQTLTLGAPGTGNIVLGNGLGNGVAHISASGLLTSSSIVNGDLSTGTFSNITGVGALSTGSIATGFGAINTSNAITGTVLNATTQLNTGGTERIDSSGNLDNIGTTQFNTVTYTWPGANGASGSILTDTGGTLSWSSASSVNFWQLNSNALSPLNEQNDLLLGSTATSSAKFAFANVAGGTPTASISAGLPGSLYLTATGILATTANQTLTLGAPGTGNIVLGNGLGNGVAHISASGLLTSSSIVNGDLSTGTFSNITGVGALSTGSIATGFGAINTSNAITGTVLNATTQLNTGGTERIDSSGNLDNIGTTQFNTVTYTWPGANGASGSILTDTGGTLSWSSASSVNFWQLNSNALSPLNEQNDLLLGSTATSSAKFAFANVAGGTPTASISAGLPGSLYLTATGILATTANQTLTLGAPGTGNIVLGNGLGNGVAHISASGLLTSSSIVNGDLSTGTFSNITGVGALSTGSIATGFGAINTSNAITGTVLNATTQLNTGGTERIDSSGNLDNIGTTQFNTVTYTWPGANGASGSILTDTGGTLSWSSASSVNFWQLNSNALSPLNEQNDLLLGSTATSSAKFAFANVAGGTPTASISAGLPGSLYLTATGILATTANQTLTLGAPGTGNIVLGNGLGNGVAHISASGLLTSSSIVNGDLSTGTFSNITGVGALSTGSIATGFGAINTSNAITGTVLNATTQLNTGGTERIDSSGNLDNIGTTQFNTVTYTWPGANGASGSILTDTGGTLSWSSASSVNFWQLNSNALSPLNEQNDLLLGSTATSSAKFAFANVAGGTPTASISAGLPGSLYLTATGILATTANQTLTLGAPGTGNIVLGNGLGNGVAHISASGLLTSSSIVNGDLSTGTFSNITGVGALSTGSIATGFGAINTSNAITGTVLNATTQLNTGGTERIDSSGNLDNIGTTQFNTVTYTWPGANGASGSILTDTGGTLSWSSASSVNFWQLNSNALSPLNEQNDLLLGSTATSSAKFAFANVAGGTPTASISAGLPGSLYLTATGILATTANQTLTLGAPGTGNIVLGNGLGNGVAHISASGLLTSSSIVNGDLSTGTFSNITGVGALSTGSIATGFGAINTSNAITGTVLNATTQLNTGGTERIDSSGNLDNIGTTQFNTVTYTWPGANGASGSILTDTGGTLSWQPAGGGGTNYWQLNAGALSPLTVSDDLLLGSTSTSSATFAFANVAGGTPTASISAGLPGSLYLTATGILATTANQTLTLGAPGTGNIVLAPGGTPALTAQGTSLITGGSLTVASSGTLTLSGITSPNDILYATNTTGVVAGATTGASGLCLVSGSYSPVWASCSSGSGGISGSGNTGQIAFFSSSNSLTSNSDLYLNSTYGLLGIGTQSPVSTLDVQGAYGENAAAIINQLNSGDIFTASSSGNTEFTIGNNGSLTAPYYATNGGLLYTNGTSGSIQQTATGATGQILTVNGSGIPTWTSPGGTLNYWQLSNGAISPANSTNDLLLGSTATSSAKFAFANVAGGTPTASISAGLPGSLYLTATGILATTANQTLTLGAPGTGNIVLGNGLGNGVAHISASGLLTSSSIVNGDLSTGTFSNITGVGALSTGSIATGFGAINTSNAITGTVLNATTQLNTGGTERIDSSGNLDNIGTTQFNTVTYTWPGANGASGSILTDTGGTLSWSSASSVNFWQLNSNALSPLNEQNDLLLGSTATSSAKFAFANVAGGTPTASISAGLPGSLYLTATGILATTANQTLTLGAPGTGNIVLGNGLGNGVAHISASGLLTSSSIVNGDLSTGTFSNITGVGALSTGSIATGFGAINTSNAITGTVLNATTQLNTGGTERIDSSGNLDNIGTTQFNTVTYTWPGANGASGSILTDTGGTLSWSSASSVNFWQLNSNALSPLNEQNDLLLGSTATSSAKFAFANVAGGTPTASISAGLPGSLYLTATGILATTANQTLTLGAPGTGNIVLGNGLGNGVAHISASGLLTSSSIVNGDLSTGTFSNITGVGALSTGSIATGFGAINTSNAITGTVLNATTQLNTGGTERIDSSGNLDNIGTTQFNTVTYTWPGANGASGSILTDTGGTLSWSSASSVNFWQLNSNALSPLNEQNDLLLGSTATSSAKFAFANVAGGTPTASISAGLPGSLYLTATGILATTANQTLTLGAPGTGNIVLAPNGTTALTAVGANLTAAGTLTLPFGNTLTGVNTGSGYVQFSNGVSFGGGTSLNITNAGAASLLSGTFSGTGNVLTLSGNAANIEYAGSGPSTITTTNTNLGLMPGTAGVGINVSSNLLALLDVRANNYSTPVASLSGQTGRATLVIDQSGVGDIFTASSSGATKFVINNAGNIIAPNYAGGNAVLYAAPSTGLFTSLTTTTGGQCLVSQTGTVAPSWGTCGAGSTNYLQLNSNALSPSNSTFDFLLGGTSTTSARFAFTGNAGNATPVASIAANPAVGTTTGLSLSGTGAIQALNNNTLTIGGSSTGNIQFLPGGNANLFLASNGYAGLGTTTVSNRLTVGDSIGATANPADTLSIGGISTTSILTLGQDNINRGALYWNYNATPSLAYLDLTTNGGQALALQQGGGKVGIGTTTPLATFDVRSTTASAPVASISGATNMASLVIDQSGSADIFTASTSGATKFVINNSGNIQLTGNSGFLNTLTTTGVFASGQTFSLPNTGGTICIDNSPSCGFSLGANYLQQNSNALSPSNSTFDFLLGGTSTASARFAFINNTGTSTTPTASISANSGGNATYLTGAGLLATTNAQTLMLGSTSTGNVELNAGGGTSELTALANGDVGIGTTSPGALLSINNNFEVNSSGVLGIGAAPSANASVLVNNTLAGGGISQTGVNSQVTFSSTATSLQSAFYGFATGGAGSYTTTTLSGLYLDTNVKGGSQTVTTNTGLFIGAQNTSSTNDYGALISGISGGSNLNAGLRITGTSASSTNYGIYDDSAAQNYFAGNIGIGTTSPFAAFDVRASSPSTPVASISGATNLATLVIDQSGNGDIFTASKSGATKFVINNSGNIEFNGATNFLTTFTSGATQAQTITFPAAAGGVGTVCYQNSAACGFALGNNYLQINGNALSPSNSTFDLLLGGTSTASAKFAFINNAGGAPTASISGNLSLVVPTGSTPQDTLNMLNGGSLNFQVSPGGNAGLQSALYIANNGDIGVNTNNPGAALDVQGLTRFTGSSTAEFYIQNNSSQEVFNVDTTNGRVGLGQISGHNFLATLDVRSSLGTLPTASISGSTSFAGLVVDNSGNGDLFTASSDGAPKFVINNAGNVGVGTTIPLNISGLFGHSLGMEIVAPSTISGANGVATIGLNSLGNGGDLIAFGANGNQYSGASGAYIGFNNTLANGLSFGTGGIANNNNLIINPGGFIGINNTVAAQVSNTGNDSLVVNQPNSSGDIFSASQSGQTKFVINNAGNVSVANYNTAGGIIFDTNASGTLGITAQGSTNQCLVSGGAGTPTWATCGASNAFSQGNGLIYAGNTTEDLAIGGNSTASAVFDVKDDDGGQGALTQWNTTTAIPTATGYAGAVTADGYVYYIGGVTGATGVPVANVYYAQLNANGTIGAWNTASSLPAATGCEDRSLAVYNGYVYVVGGCNFSANTSSATVYYAPINANGTLGAWSTTTSLPTATGEGSTVVSNGNIYYIGGWTTNDSTVVSTVWMAPINANGTIGAWATTAPLPAIRDNGSAIVANGYIYYFGGQNTNSTWDNTVYSAQISSNGQLVHWAAVAGGGGTTPQPNGWAGGGAVVANGFVYLLSGSGSVANYGTDYYDQIGENGTLGGTWTQTSSYTSGNVVSSPASFTANGYIYIISGYNYTDTTAYTTAYYTSTPRVQIDGSLDLLGLTGALDASGSGTMGGGGSVGGSIYAGDIFSNGSLEVTGDSQFWNGLAISGNESLDGNLSINSTSGTTPAASVSATSSYAGMVVNNSGTGSIFTASNSGNTRFVIQNGGNVGIGTSQPGYALDVQNSQAATAAARIWNTSANNVACGTGFQCHTALILQLGAAGATQAPTTDDYFLNFLQGNGTSKGFIEGNSNGVTYSTGGADYAENYAVDPNLLPQNYTEQDIANIFPTGTLVCQDSNGVIPCYTTSDPNILGIISASPAVEGGQEGPNTVVVGLLGQLPVKVSSANGTINAGDKLAASSIPGVAVKATSAGEVIGTAEQSYTDSNPNDVGTINVSANRTWYDPDVYLTSTGNINLLNNGTNPQTGEPMYSVVNNGQDISRIGVYQNSVIGNLQAGNIDAQSITLAGQNLNSNILGLQLAASSAANLSEKIDTLTSLNNQVQSHVNTIAQSVNNLQTQVSSQEGQLTTIQNMLSTEAGFTASSSSELDLDSLNTNTATVSGSLTELGQSLFNNVGITGDLTDGVLSINGLDSSGQASINTVGDLKLQDEGAGGINILSGKVTIDTNGNIVSQGQITASKYNVNIQDVSAASLGSGTLPAGQTSVTIQTTAVTSKSSIFITPVTLTNTPLAVTSQQTGTSFTVEVSAPQSEYVRFNWWIIN